MSTHEDHLRHAQLDMKFRAQELEKGQCAIGAMGSCAGPTEQVRPPVILRQVALEADSDFAGVLGSLKRSQGCERMSRATRAGWNGRGMWVGAQFPDTNSKMGAPYLYISNPLGVKVPWTPSQADLFARDWALLPWNDAEST